MRPCSVTSQATWRVACCNGNTCKLRLLCWEISIICQKQLKNDLSSFVFGHFFDRIDFFQSFRKNSINDRKKTACEEEWIRRTRTSHPAAHNHKAGCRRSLLIKNSIIVAPLNFHKQSKEAPIVTPRDEHLEHASAQVRQSRRLTTMKSSRERTYKTHTMIRERTNE